jgi:hypothetical protein
MADGPAEKDTQVTSTSRAARNAQVIALALLALLIVFHLVNNLLWQMSNVLVYSMDQMFHQVTSLAYYEILRESVNLHTLFSALTWSDYYPPLVHLTVTVFYKLFGVSMDVAALSNSLWLVALLLAVYGISHSLCTEPLPVYRLCPDGHGRPQHLPVAAQRALCAQGKLDPLWRNPGPGHVDQMDVRRLCRPATSGRAGFPGVGCCGRARPPAIDLELATPAACPTAGPGFDGALVPSQH